MNIANFAASIGIGAAQFYIHVPNKYCPRGTVVHGDVELIGGHVPQHIEFLSAAMVEHWPGGKTMHFEEREVRILATNFDIIPHARIIHPFEFQIQDDARLTDSTGSNGWRLNAMADIAMALNPRAMMELQVTVHREILAVQEALEKVGFKRTALHAPSLLPLPPEEVQTNYRAAPKLQSQLDGATLQLRAQGEWVMGRLIINRKETNMAEFLKSMVGGNNEEFPVSIPRAELLTPDGMPCPEGAKGWIAGILEEVIVLPGDLKKRLLRPASRPASEDCNLLRPIHDVLDPTKGSTLLRPSKRNLEEERDPTK